MSFPGPSPSNILREALLEYSEGQRRSRERSRRRRRHRGGRSRSQPSEEPRQIQFDLEPVPVPPLQEQRFQPASTKYTFEEAKKEEKGLAGDIASPVATSLDSFHSDIAAIRFQSGSDLLREISSDQGKQEDMPKSKPDLEDQEPSAKSPFQEDDSTISDSGDVVTFNEEYESVGWCKKKYHVAHDLSDGDSYVQSRFLQKVFAMIFVKTFILLAYLSLVEMLDDFKTFYQDTFKYHFLSIGIYLVIKITIRLTKNFRRQNRCLHLILHMMDIIALGDFLGGAMSHWLPAFVYFVVPRKILYSIGGTSLFFIYVGWFVEYDMRDGIMIGSAFIINGLAALHQVLHGTIRGYGFDPNMGSVTDEWSSVLIVLGVSEVIMMWIMFELKSVLSGNRYSVWYTDWFFTGVYVI